MRGEELKGYLAGLRHAASLVREDAKKAEADGWATSRAISERLKSAALRIDGAGMRLEGERKRQGIPSF